MYLPIQKVIRGVSHFSGKSSEHIQGRIDAGAVMEIGDRIVVLIEDIGIGRSQPAAGAPSGRNNTNPVCLVTGKIQNPWILRSVKFKTGGGTLIKWGGGLTHMRIHI